MLYGHLYHLRWGDNVKVESRYGLSLFNALKYSWTLGHNPKVVSAWDLLSFRFYTIEEYMVTISMQLDKKTAITCKKNRLWGVGCVSLPFHMPYAIISQDVANEFRRKQRPKCNMLVKNEPTKDPSTRRMNTQIQNTHTHTRKHILVWKMCNRKPKNFQHWIVSFFFASLLFCFGYAPAHEGAIWNWNCFRNLKCWQAAHKNIFIIKQRTSNHFRSLYEAFSLRL